MKVAIDGPAGAGKSSVAKAVAKKLGFIYVDTGALYRAVGLYAIRNNVNTKSATEVEKLLPDITAELAFVNGEQHVFLCKEDVSDKIRTEEVSMAASNVSAIPMVRAFLFDLQRGIAKDNNVIMDGRDIGTVVLPDSEVKIFLTAKDTERAKRRVLQLAQKGINADYSTVLEDVQKRDYNDSHRQVAPLCQAEGAILIDNTCLTEEEVLKIVLSAITEKME